MDMFTIASPVLKSIIGRLGRPEVIDQPAVLKPGGSGAVVVCNHVGWADSVWLAYTLYPRQLRFISKQELFHTPVMNWVFVQSGCIPIDRADPSPNSIRTAVDLLRQGEVILIFPSGTRSQDNVVYKRGAATMALHAQVPIVPAYYRGPTHMKISHLVGRPRVQISFGEIIPTLGLRPDRAMASGLTRRMQVAIEALGAVDVLQLSA